MAAWRGRISSGFNPLPAPEYSEIFPSLFYWNDLMSFNPLPVLEYREI